MGLLPMLHVNSSTTDKIDADVVFVMHAAALSQHVSSQHSTACTSPLGIQQIPPDNP
jgi:hypothetical protein